MNRILLGSSRTNPIIEGSMYFTFRDLAFSIVTTPPKQRLKLC
jgi:hypothetical protein